MSFIDKIKQTGISADLPDWKAAKLASLNKSTLISIIIYFPFIFLFWNYGYQVLSLSVVGAIALKAGHYLMMSQGLYNLTRLLQSTFGGSAFIMIIHLLSREPGSSPIFSLFIVQIGLSLLPMALFDNREKKFYYAGVMINFTALVLALTLDGMNVWGYSDMVFREGSLHYILLAIGIIYLLAYANRISSISWEANQEQQGIIDQMSDKQQELEKNSAKLNEYVEQVQQSRKEDEKRQWIVQGSNAISKILRSNSSTNELMDELLAEIVKYSGANQGGLFVKEYDETGTPYLHMNSCYAYDRKKFLDKRIEIGQGLIGQCYLEAEPTILTEVPENYVQITSGLGEALPRCIVMIPLIDQEKVQGVLELAAFKPLEPHETQYLEEVAGSIASFLSNMKVNRQTQMLLEESKVQAEKLQSQEEEMRQNMEEMLATQEELNRLRKEDEQKMLQIQEEKEALLQKVKELEGRLLAD